MMLRYFLLALILVSAGCQSSGPSSQKAASADYSNNQYEALATAYALPGSGKDALVHDLNAMKVHFAAGDAPSVIARLEAIRLNVEALDQQAEISASGEVAEALTNPGMRAYRPKVVDRIFMHIYGGLAHLFSGDLAGARVEMRAAYDAQQRVASIKERELMKLREMVAEAKSEGTEASTAETSNMFLNLLSNNEEFKANYAGLPASSRLDLSFDAEMELVKADYESAFSHYIQGITFLLTAEDGADLDRAIKSLEFAKALAPQTTCIDEDLIVARERMNPQQPVAPRVWVIHENGMAPAIDQVLVEFSFANENKMSLGSMIGRAATAGAIRIPVPTSNSLFSSLMLAFPTMQFQDQAETYPQLTLSDINLAPVGYTEQLTSIDAMMGREFQDELPALMQGAIIGGIVKAIAAQLLQDQAGGMWGVVGAVGNKMLASADKRSWKYLPKEFRVASFAPPTDGRLTLSADNGILAVNPLQISVPADGCSLVYVLTPVNRTVPRVYVLPLNFDTSLGYLPGPVESYNKPIMETAAPVAAPVASSEL